MTAMQTNDSLEHKTVFESIFGSKDYSLNGPLFYFICGIISLIGLIGLYFLGVYIPSVFNDSSLLRPDIIFPFIGIRTILCLSGAAVGICLGILGILWSIFKK